MTYVLFDDGDLTYHTGNGEWATDERFAMRYSSSEAAQKELEEIDCEKTLRDRIHVLRDRIHVHPLAVRNNGMNQLPAWRSVESFLSGLNFKPPEFFQMDVFWELVKEKRETCLRMIAMLEGKE